MVSLALAAERGYELSTVDAERPRPTYTVDTLRDLVEEYGSAKNLYFILGADNLSRLLQWHASAELLRLAHVVGCSRPGYRLIDPGLPPGTLTLLHIPRLEISATKIRRLIRAGRSVWHLTPEAVGRYIHNHGLYRCHGDARTSTSMKTTPRQDRAVDRDRLIVETSL
jgi:nicotinate-nucleotide adenylyltransferase